MSDDEQTYSPESLPLNNPFCDKRTPEAITFTPGGKEGQSYPLVTAGSSVCLVADRMLISTLETIVRRKNKNIRLISFNFYHLHAMNKH